MSDGYEEEKHLENDTTEAEGLLDTGYAWMEFITLTNACPFHWAVYPQGEGQVTIEFFAPGYSGDLEKGTGEWDVDGPSLAKAVGLAKKRYEEWLAENSKRTE